MMLAEGCLAFYQLKRITTFSAEDVVIRCSDLASNAGKKSVSHVDNR